MSLSNYDIVYACSELFSIYIIYYFFRSLLEYRYEIRQLQLAFMHFILY